jgi:hypothetical protein
VKLWTEIVGNARLSDMLLRTQWCTFGEGLTLSPARKIIIDLEFEEISGQKE